MHKPQPKKSNWCWAACLSNIINGLESDSRIGKTQCNLVSYYRKYLDNRDSKITTYEDCCRNLHQIEDSCNLGINDNDISIMHEVSGFKVKEVDSHNILNYNWVEATLKQTNAPLLLKTKIGNQGNQAHANLVVGFGKIGNCEYLLISDPIDNTLEYYEHIELISEKYDIEKIWMLSKSDDKLSQDEEINKRFNKIKAFIKNLELEVHDELLNPLNYLGYKYAAEIDDLISKTHSYLLNNEALQTKLVEDFINQRIADNCQKRISKCPENDNQIIGLDFKDIIDPSDHIKQTIIQFDDCRTFLKTHAIELQVSIHTETNYVFKSDDNLKGFREAATIEGDISSTDSSYGQIVLEDKVMVKPINYPSNYNISTELQTLSEFIEQTKKLPKATFFAHKEKPLLE